MAETYCGKSCLECERKEILNCPGCKLGPGKLFGGDCKLAECCRDKGHQDCSTCGFRVNCGTLRSKERVPEYRLKSIEAEKIRIAENAKRAPVLGKWLWILFWLIIPSSIASVMTNENITALIPSFFVPGYVLNAICAFVYGFVLIQLGSEEERYRTAGICALISGVPSLLIAYFSEGPASPVWMLLLTLPAVVVSLVGKYNEFTAHCTVLTGFDNELSEKWSTLWKWYIGMYGAVFGSIVVILIVPILGLLIPFAAAIGLLVVSILNLSYLYRTAKLFKEYPVGLGD